MFMHEYYDFAPFGEKMQVIQRVYDQEERFQLHAGRHKCGHFWNRMKC